MMSCRECGKELSDLAKVCPHCGAPNRDRVKPFKWWLWVPLGLVAAFLGFGALQPAYLVEAIRMREACEKMGGTPYQCQQVYDERISRGKLEAASGGKKDTCPPEAPGCSWGK